MSERVACLVCDRVYRSLEALERHERREHPVPSEAHAGPSEAPARERARLLDQIALVSALAELVQAGLQRDLSEVALIRLARRLVQDGRLSDVEAVRLAGREALEAVSTVRAGDLTQLTQYQEKPS